MSRLIPHPKSLVPGRGLIPNPKSPIPVRGLIDGVIRGINALLAASLAPACAVCNGLLEQPTQGCVCEDCWRSILPITPPLCDRCGDPLPRQPGSAIPIQQLRCRPCRTSGSAVSRARAIGEYEGTLREIIHALKYAGRWSLARALAGQMRIRGRELLDEADAVVPVPLHWRREYQRGFNQAREIARHLGVSVVEALRRTRPTRPQIELAADRRRANLAGAFAMRKNGFGRPIVRGKIVLLIDDVSTTGATLDSCAAVLKDSGALDVYALTAARVVSRGSHANSLIATHSSLDGS